MRVKSQPLILSHGTSWANLTSINVLGLEDSEQFDTKESIRDFPDHATFREKSVTTGPVGQVWGFPFLTLCKKTNFDLILLVECDVFQKGLNMKEIYGMSSFPWCNSPNDTSLPYILKI